MTRTSESRFNTDTALTEIAWLSAQDPDREFHSLMHHINVDSLRRCFDMLDGKKAVGADRITKEQYGEQVQENLESLIHRMKHMGYRPGPVRQVLIPKEGKPGATRPLGISNFEDKLVQKRVQGILESVYDPIFLNASYGFRTIFLSNSFLPRFVIRHSAPLNSSGTSTSAFLSLKLQTVRSFS